MPGSTPIPTAARDCALTTHRAAAYLHGLPALPADSDVSKTLTDGLTLVADLLCGDETNAASQDINRKLAGLILEKMQRITHGTLPCAPHQAYPCFSC